MKKIEIKVGSNPVVVWIGMVLILIVLILWFFYGSHYVWVPLETTFEAGV